MTSGIRGVAGAVDQIEASADIKREREWGFGDKPSWSEYGQRVKEQMGNEFLSPDDPEHGWYDADESAGRSWLTQRPSAMGRAHLPLAAANIVMWGTNPVGAVVAAGFVFAPEAMFRGMGAVVSGVHVAQDTVRTLYDQVSRGMDKAREKIAAKEAATDMGPSVPLAEGDQPTALRPATAEDRKRGSVQTVEFTSPGP